MYCMNSAHAYDYKGGRQRETFLTNPDTMLSLLREGHKPLQNKNNIVPWKDLGDIPHCH